jgi:hypothetical protein
MSHFVAATKLCLSFATLVLFACRPPFVVLTVDDPNGVAAGFSLLEAGSARDHVAPVAVDKRTFPLAITVTSDRTGAQEIWVKAANTIGKPLGWGHTIGVFSTSGTPLARVQLGKGCDNDADCDNGLYCDGTETCGSDGECADGALPCQGAVTCVVSRCTEADGGIGACSTPEPDDSACAIGMYCDPTADCVPCSVPERCGPLCTACSGTTPLCGGDRLGCICDALPVPNGSCGVGMMCSQSLCVACNSQAACGPDCVTCGGNTPVCGGTQASCVALDCTGLPDFTPCQLVTAPDFWYDICVEGTCVSPGDWDATSNEPGPSFAQADVVMGWEYPDTGQRICYDAAAMMTCTTFPCAADGTPVFCGQDAQYGWDTNHGASERYTRAETIAGEPVVLDNLTGLLWQGCAAGLAGSSCDRGLTAGLTWRDALRFCNELNWAARGDWRLPDFHELGSIVDRGIFNPSIDPAAFPGTPVGDFWTSSPCAGIATSSWMVYFGNGSVASDYPWGSQFSVRCVRREPPVLAVAPRFWRSEPVAGEPAVADSRTGLVWQGCAAGLSGTACATGSAASYTWQNALEYCEDLNWAGLSDWHLSSGAELLSLVDTRQYNPAIDTVAFPRTPASVSWSSSSSAAHADGAWNVDFMNGAAHDPGSSAYSGKVEAHCVRCVRRGP